MKRYFNTEGICRPDRHYMVRLDERLIRIKERYVDRGRYFVINRGRQYGKTTTLRALDGYLRPDYLVVSIDFQIMSSAAFENENKFAVSFAKYFLNATEDETDGLDSSLLQELVDEASNTQFDLGKLFVCLSRICASSTKPLVMLIDEVDSASNHQVFLDFLSLLRGYYLDRERRPIFRSVILAGLYDIKNLKLKIRSEEGHQYNSPWNIAAKFNIRMSFSTEQIASMLQEYEDDNHIGMDVGQVAEYIFDYTSGYPYLVSLISKLMDEELPEEGKFLNASDIWTKQGIEEAVQIILKERMPLFDSMVKQLDAYSDLRHMLEEILYQGKQIPFSLDLKSIDLGTLFGFLKEEDGHIAIANRIFEMRLLNMFIAEEAVSSEAFRYGQRNKSQFIRNRRLDMDLVLEKFVEYFTDIYGDNDEKFVEEYGRKFFLLYLKPIINGTGNYYIEARTRDARRTDVIVDYQGEQFIVELKIWHGSEYNQRGEEQLVNYLDFYHQDKGYLLSFNFNKTKQIGVKQIKIGDKMIVEAVV